MKWGSELMVQQQISSPYSQETLQLMPVLGELFSV